MTGRDGPVGDRTVGRDGSVAPLPGWMGRLVDALAGVSAADLVRHGPLEDGSGRASAVLITLADTAAGPGVLLIRRAAQLRNHAGQIAFPGGAAEAGEDPTATALREAGEEVGLDPASVQVAAVLPELYVPASGFLVTPVLAWWREPHPVRAMAPSEVAAVAVVGLAELADPAHRFIARGRISGRLGPGFEADGLFIWGFTAGLLDALLGYGGWARDWDETVVREPPIRRA